MSFEEYKTIEDGNYRARIVYDDNGDAFPSPRSDYDHAGVMWASHRDYWLGDRDYKGELTGPAADLDVFIREMEEFHAGGDLIRAVLKHLQRHYGTTVVLPLYLYEHSGISISAGANLLDGGGVNTRTHNPFDPGGWDTSFVGLIFNRPHDNEWGPTAMTEEAMQDEVREYNDYLTGQVYGVIIEERVTRTVETRRMDGAIRSTVEGEGWDEVEACWGYIGSDNAESAARGDLAYYADKKEVRL